MQLTPKRIAVLFHEGDRNTPLSGYIVDHLARFWREDGHEVEYVFGTSTYVPADIVLVHVNLSVVPTEYLEFARAYPIVLNGRLRDIRKSVFSTNLVGRGDTWPGSVVVKSDLNFGGSPERVLTGGWLDRNSRLWRAARKTGGWISRRHEMSSWTDYRVYESIADVPASLLKREDVVVEKFLPEQENGLFHLRVYQALGDRWTCTRLASPHPIFKAGMSVSAYDVEPHPEIEEWRARLELDYGKLDYLVHNGEVVLIDVNKTTGASAHMGSDALQAMRRRLAEGLYAYLA